MRKLVVLGFSFPLGHRQGARAVRVAVVRTSREGGFRDFGGSPLEDRSITDGEDNG